MLNVTNNSIEFSNDGFPFSIRDLHVCGSNRLLLCFGICQFVALNCHDGRWEFEQKIAIETGNLKRKRFTLFANIIEFRAASSFIGMLEFPLAFCVCVCIGHIRVGHINTKYH